MTDTSFPTKTLIGRCFGLPDLSLLVLRKLAQLLKHRYVRHEIPKAAKLGLALGNGYLTQDMDECASASLYQNMLQPVI